ncbi:MAG: glycosyltransferase family 4 protein [Verrucomicrobia bacterium]|nr:glycosyltransferase family 4 protein [Verrucomicrobiota bacterium]
MRVAIDTNGCYTVQAGVARYIRGLLGGLRQLRGTDLEFFEFAWEVENFTYRQPQRALKTFYRELIWCRHVAPRLLTRHHADLLHSTTGYLITPPDQLPNVITVHDLAFLRFPKRFRPWQRWAGRRNLEKVATARRVICISQFTADEAIQLLGLSASKIEIVYNGCDFQSIEASPTESRPEFAVPSEFFLFVGSLEPGKNLSLLREIYAGAERTGKRLPPLMIVGARWEGVAGEGRPPADWHYLGRQPDETLIYLYRRALALVFPSKYEGFGLPVVEAMALGCPVLCGSVASLPEVGGEAALYAKLQTDEFGQAMLRLAGDETLRYEMAEKGREHVKKFNWHKCASETAAVYRQALS